MLQQLRPVRDSIKLVLFYILVAAISLFPHIELAFRQGEVQIYNIISAAIGLCEFVTLLLILRSLAKLSKQFSLGSKIKYLNFILVFIIITIYLIQDFSIHMSNNYVTEMAINNLADFRMIGFGLIFFVIIMAVSISTIVYHFVDSDNLHIIADGWKSAPRYISLVFLVILFSGYNVIPDNGSMVFSGQLPPLTSLVTTYTHTTRYYKLLYSYIDELEYKDKSETVQYLKTKVFDRPLYQYNKTANNAALNINSASEIKNVIVIFIEGTTARLLGSYGGHHSGLTNNIDAFADNSILVYNYYNHTAATFRGIQGQLTSTFNKMSKLEGDEGASWDNISENDCNQFISVPSILRNYGFRSVFFHPEQRGNNFDKMLNTLGFDEVYSKNLIIEKFLNNSASYDKTWYLSDRNLISGIISYLKTTEADQEKRFISWYSVGTHAFFNITEDGFRYGDGKNSSLNRLYNADMELGRLFDYLKSSAYSSNTLVILTSDHSAFPEPPTVEACKNHGCSSFFIDEIPLIIFSPGFQLRRLNAEYRNSLSLAPTILHMLNIQNTKNTFLGKSLFENKELNLSSYSAIGSDFFYYDETGVWHINNFNNASDGRGHIWQVPEKKAKIFWKNINMINKFYDDLDNHRVISEESEISCLSH